MLVWGSRGIPYTVTRTKWPKKVTAAPCSETAWAKKLKKCTETCFWHTTTPINLVEIDKIFDKNRYNGQRGSCNVSVGRYNNRTMQISSIKSSAPDPAGSSRRSLIDTLYSQFGNGILLAFPYALDAFASCPSTCRLPVLLNLSPASRPSYYSVGCRPPKQLDLAYFEPKSWVSGHLIESINFVQFFLHDMTYI